MPSPNHTTWIEISASNLSHNMTTLRRLVGPDVTVAATVKSNAYGHGLMEASKIFLSSGADWLSVHSVEEALELRRSGIISPIYVLGYVPFGRLRDIVEHQLDVVIYDAERLHELHRQAALLDIPARIHLKLETGLNRQGATETEIIAMARHIDTTPLLSFRGLTTHFANIEDTASPDFALAQHERFKACKARLAAMNLHPTYCHIANSAATLLYPKTYENLVRPGIACYGIWPSELTKGVAKAQQPIIQLRPAFTWKSMVAQVKTLRAGETVGYGRTFTAPASMKIAVVPVGYHEGFDRRAGDRGRVLIRACEAPIVGRVSMNNIMVDCNNCPSVQPEDEVVLIGQQGDAQITATEVASWSERIPYEVPTRIGATLSGQIPRIVVD